MQRRKDYQVPLWPALWWGLLTAFMIYAALNHEDAEYTLLPDAWYPAFYWVIAVLDGVWTLTAIREWRKHRG